MRSVDRISALPSELIRHILCLMPTKDAVTTTILSKRWKNLWVLVPNLDFYDDRDFCFEYEGCDRFATFVSRVLYFRDSIDIHKCSLVIYYPHDFSRIDDWFCTIVRRNVVELEFSFDVFNAGDGPFPIPECLFMCKTLRILKLNLWESDFSVDPPTSGCFPSLKVLHVIVCSHRVLSMEKIYSCCPVLEVLTIEGIMAIGTDEVYCFKVFAPELKTLKISFECECYKTRQNVYINAPKLENLYLRMDGLTNYFLMGSVKSLVNANIAFREFKEEKPPCFCNQEIMLLDVVSNVKYLSLSAHWYKDWHIPALGNLNQLKLVLCDCNYWELLADFLHRAPNLEDFVLENRTKCGKEYSVRQWNPPRDVPICLSSHLKTISITGFKGRQAEMEVAKYLLKNGSFLNKMTIYTDPLYAEEEDLYKEFSMFHRMTACRVEFIKMPFTTLGGSKFLSWLSHDERWMIALNRYLQSVGDR